MSQLSYMWFVVTHPLRKEERQQRAFARAQRASQFARRRRRLKSKGNFLTRYLSGEET